MEGVHSFEENKKITENVLTAVFESLKDIGVDLSGMILKPNMVTSGSNHPEQAAPDTVAAETLELFISS